MPRPFRWLSDWEVATHSTPLTLDDIGFVIMASDKHEVRQTAMRETWARDLMPSALLIVTGDGAADRDTFYAAQRRQFVGIKRVRSTFEHKKWVVLADDDTFVNTCHLVRWLSRFRPADLLVLGHVLPSFRCFWGEVAESNPRQGAV